MLYGSWLKTEEKHKCKSLLVEGNNLEQMARNKGKFQKNPSKVYSSL